MWALVPHEMRQGAFENQYHVVRWFSAHALIFCFCGSMLFTNAIFDFPETIVHHTVQALILGQFLLSVPRASAFHKKWQGVSKNQPKKIACLTRCPKYRFLLRYICAFTNENFYFVETKCSAHGKCPMWIVQLHYERDLVNHFHTLWFSVADVYIVCVLCWLYRTVGQKHLAVVPLAAPHRQDVRAPPTSPQAANQHDHACNVRTSSSFSLLAKYSHREEPEAVSFSVCL